MGGWILNPWGGEDEEVEKCRKNRNTHKIVNLGSLDRGEKGAVANSQI
jgi:hypothetical protein